MICAHAGVASSLYTVTCVVLVAKAGTAAQYPLPFKYAHVHGIILLQYQVKIATGAFFESRLHFNLFAGEYH